MKVLTLCVSTVAFVVANAERTVVVRCHQIRGFDLCSCARAWLFAFARLGASTFVVLVLAFAVAFA